jgi:hypothetical protein
VGEELEMTLGELRGLHDRRGGRGRWRVRLYDYAANRWCEAGEAFSREGLYELGTITDPYGRTVRVRIVPEGRGAISVDAGSAGDVGVWGAMGVRMPAPALAALRAALAGRGGPVPLAEADAVLAGVEAEGGEHAQGARAGRAALRSLLERPPPPAGGRGSGRGSGSGSGRGGGRGRRRVRRGHRGSGEVGP